MMKKHKFEFSLDAFLNKATPSFFKRLGNAMFATATTVALPTFMADHKTAAIIVFVIGGIGKFLSEFFVAAKTNE